MNEETFLCALRDDPADELTWLALADWLEEDGQELRAELLRLVRRLRTLPVMRRTKPRATLEDRVALLLASDVRPVAPEITNGIDMRLALIPPGRFRLGSPTTERERSGERRARELALERPFYLGVFPVTQAQYQAVTGTNPSHFQHGRSPKVDGIAAVEVADFPVERVSWDDAAAFLARLNARTKGETPRLSYRLPTEAEWEYACRGGSASSGPFHLGTTLDSTQANFWGAHPYGGAEIGPYLERTTAVGSYVPNAFGLYDMHGNVFEWCRLYHNGGEDGTEPVQAIRGGAYMAYGFGCRSAYRYTWAKENREPFCGFRVAADTVASD